MKRNLLIIIFCFVLSLQGFAQGTPVFLPQDTAVCGGERMKYYITPKSTNTDFESYSWSVEGGLFDNGEDTYVNTDQDDPTAWVTWSETPSSSKAKVRVVVVKDVQQNNVEFEEEPYVFAVATPDQIYQAVNGEVKVPAGSVNFTFSIADDQSWWVTSYNWRFHPAGGSTRSFSSGTTKQKTVSFTGTEYGTFDVRSKTTRGDCDITSDPLTVDLIRYLEQPGQFTAYDEIMCNNTTSDFTINSVAEADMYLWETTGGFTLKDGSNWVTSLETSDTTVTVKSRSSNGGGTISVTAEPQSTDTHTLDSEPREMDLWSGVFTGINVSGTAAVCHN